VAIYHIAVIIRHIPTELHKFH